LRTTTYYERLVRGSYSSTIRAEPGAENSEGGDMILATTRVDDVDHWISIYSTTSAEKRKQHGSKGSTVFRDPNEEDRVWALFDWDAEGWQNFVSDPEVGPILQQAGHKSKPQMAELLGRYDA
jgi:hypothetical protein